jgi:hypothetical protein
VDHATIVPPVSLAATLPTHRGASDRADRPVRDPIAALSVALALALTVALALALTVAHVRALTVALARALTVALARALTVAHVRALTVAHVPVVLSVRTGPSSHLSPRRTVTPCSRPFHPSSCPLPNSCFAVACPPFARPSNCKTRMHPRRVVR